LLIGHKKSRTSIGRLTAFVKPCNNHNITFITSGVGKYA
jgi:hypothetical protein